MSKKITLEFCNIHKDRELHYRITISPGNPVTRCTVEYQHAPIIEQCWTLESSGIGVLKPGDTYDLETGCRMALRSALREIEDKAIRKLAWAFYFKAFPLQSQAPDAITLKQAIGKAKSIIAQHNFYSWPLHEVISLGQDWTLVLQRTDNPSLLDTKIIFVASLFRARVYAKRDFPPVVWTKTYRFDMLQPSSPEPPSPPELDAEKYERAMQYWKDLA